MQKLASALLLIVIVTIFQGHAFAGALKCSFKTSERLEGIKSLIVADESLVINGTMIIPLEHSRIKCAQFGRQHRFDGLGAGIQIILKSCTDQAILQGHLIDSASSKAAEVVCNEMTL